MVNVVFLLLVFFLLTATVAPPPPFPVELPEGPAVADAGGADVLFVGADGALALGALRGDAVFAALRARGRGKALELRADASVPAAEIARLLARLAEAGIAGTRLVMVRP